MSVLGDSFLGKITVVRLPMTSCGALLVCVLVQHFASGLVHTGHLRRLLTLYALLEATHPAAEQHHLHT